MQEKQKKRGVKRNSQDCLSILKPKSKFCFLSMPKLQKLIFYIWNRRQQSDQLTNSSFGMFWLIKASHSDQKKAHLASKGYLVQSLHVQINK